MLNGCWLDDSAVGPFRYGSLTSTGWFRATGWGKVNPGEVGPLQIFQDSVKFRRPKADMKKRRIRPIPDIAATPPLKNIFLLGFPLAAIGSAEPIFLA